MSESRYPVYKSHEDARCWKCGGPLGGKPEVSGYPTGRHAALCPKCEMKTFYDIKVEGVVVHTGRWSCREPNLQSLPKPEGHEPSGELEEVTCDFHKGEMIHYKRKKVE